MSAVSKTWAEAVLALYGPYCIVCGDRHIELDHVMPKSQGGQYHPGNGVPVCSVWSSVLPGEGHHKQKTERKLKYRREWLRPETIEHLAEQGWVNWDAEGIPYGRGSRGFERTSAATLA